jgi:hypothetical protein
MPCAPRPGTPIRMRHEMGAGLQEDLDDTGACSYFLLMRNFDQEFPHIAGTPFPEQMPDYYKKD